jgi:hypothetical protein
MRGGILEGVGTPDDLVVVDQVVRILIGLVDEVDRDLLLGMREGAEIPILTGHCISSVGLAELGFVATGMIELFDLIVGLPAGAVGFVTGDVRVALKIRPAFILVIVVV